MTNERCRNSIAWLTMVGLIMISGLSAQADDGERAKAADDKPQAEVRVKRAEATQTATISDNNEQEIVVDGERVVDEKSARSLNVVEGDVLIITGDGEEQSGRVLRIEAQPAGDVLAIRRDDEGAGATEELGKYWIGVQLNDVSPALRAQLNLEENRGALVGEVLPDSPASKAGVKQYDIVLAIGDTKVNGNEDIIKAVKAADGKEIKLTLLRGGSERSISVTPVERPKRETVNRAPQDANAFVDWIQNLQQFQQTQPAMMGELPSFNVVRPGQAMVLRQEWPMVRQAALPEDLSITVTREGKAPARIRIKQKEREIDTTEDKFNEIPEDVRRYVEPMLGRGRAAISMRGGGAMALPQFNRPQQRARVRMMTKPEPAGDVLIPAPPGWEEPQRRVRALPAGGPAAVEKRVEELERRLESLQREVRDTPRSDDAKK